MAGASTQNAGRIEAMGRLKDWTRDRFGLPADATILVSEMACALPGFPPRETHVLFLAGGGKRHHFKVFKPVMAIGQEDLPYAWLKDTLVIPEGAGCDCC